MPIILYLYSAWKAKLSLPGLYTRVKKRGSQSPVKSPSKCDILPKSAWHAGQANIHITLSNVQHWDRVSNTTTLWRVPGKAGVTGLISNEELEQVNTILFIFVNAVLYYDSCILLLFCAWLGAPGGALLLKFEHERIVSISVTHYW